MRGISQIGLKISFPNQERTLLKSRRRNLKVRHEYIFRRFVLKISGTLQTAISFVVHIQSNPPINKFCHRTFAIPHMKHKHG